MIEPGLYEQLLTEALRGELQFLDEALKPTRRLHTAEAADRIALYLSRRIQRTLESVGDSDRVKVGVVHSGSWARPATVATLARGRWLSPGSWPRRCRGICINCSPRRWHDGGH